MTAQELIEERAKLLFGAAAECEDSSAEWEDALTSERRIWLHVAGAVEAEIRVANRATLCEVLFAAERAICGVDISVRQQMMTMIAGKIAALDALAESQNRVHEDS